MLQVGMRVRIKYEFAYGTEGTVIRTDFREGDTIEDIPVVVKTDYGYDCTFWLDELEPIQTVE